MSLRDKIQELVQIMRDEDLAEIEVRRWFSSVRVRRPGQELSVGALAPQSVHQAAEG